MDVSIVTVNWNVRELLRGLIASVPAAVGKLKTELIIVDNDSHDGSVEMLRREYPEVVTIASPDNLGFARGNNLGLERAQGEYVALVNPDMVLHPSVIEGLVEFLRAHPRVGMTGPKICLPSGEVQSEPGTLPSGLTVLKTLPGMSRLSRWLETEQGPITQPRRCEYLHGSFMLLPRRVLEEVGRMPVLTFMYGEEIMLGHLLRKHGYEVWYHPGFSVTHHDDASADQRWQPAEKLVAKRKAHAVVLKRVLSRPNYLAYNSIMAAREGAREVRARLSGRADGPHRALCSIHLQSLRGGAD